MENTKTDELVLKLFNTVKEKQKEIEKAERPKWVTSCTLGQNPDSVQDRVNIQTVTDIDKLILLYGFLELRNKEFFVGCSELGIKKKFKWMGYSVDDWKTDIKSRVAQININTKKKELQVLEERLDKLISTEQRRGLELAEISNLLE